MGLIPINIGYVGTLQRDEDHFHEFYTLKRGTCNLCDRYFRAIAGRNSIIPASLFGSLQAQPLNTLVSYSFSLVYVNGSP